MLLLGTQDQAIEVLSLQQDGKGTVDAASFLNGWKGSGKSLPIKVLESPG